MGLSFLITYTSERIDELEYSSVSIMPYYHAFLLLGSLTEYAFQICLFVCVYFVEQTILMTSLSFLKRLRIFLIIRIKRTNSIEGGCGCGMGNLKNSIYLKGPEGYPIRSEEQDPSALQWEHYVCVGCSYLEPFSWRLSTDKTVMNIPPF